MRWWAYCTQLLVNFFPRGFLASGRAGARGYLFNTQPLPRGSRGGAGQKRGALGTMHGGKGEPLVSSLQNCGRGKLCLAQRGSKPLKSGSYSFPPALHLLPSSPGPPAGRPTRRDRPHWGPKPWSFMGAGTRFHPAAGFWPSASKPDPFL